MRISAGKPSASETVPLAATRPPLPIAAEALRIVTVWPSMAAINAMSPSLVFDCGSMNSAPTVENMPRTEGFARLPETLALSFNVPVDLGAAIGEEPVGERQRRIAGDGEREPRPGERHAAIGRHVKPCGPLTACRAERQHPAVVAAFRRDVERLGPGAGQRGGAYAGRLELECGGRIGKRSGHLGRTGQAAAEILAGRHGVENGEREGLQGDVERQIAAVERHRARHRGIQPVRARHGGGEIEPAGGRAALGIDRQGAEPCRIEGGCRNLTSRRA